VGGGAVGAGAVVPVPVVVVVAVLVVDDEVGVSVVEAPGDEVGEDLPVLFSVADGVGLACAPDSVGDGVPVGLAAGAVPDGDGVVGVLPPRFVSVVPDVAELPRGWPMASSDRFTTAIAATNSTPATAATGPQRRFLHHCLPAGPASGSGGSSGGTAAGSCADASRGPVPLPAGRTTRTLLARAARLSEVE